VKTGDIEVIWRVWMSPRGADEIELRRQGALADEQRLSAPVVSEWSKYQAQIGPRKRLGIYGLHPGGTTPDMILQRSHHDDGNLSKTFLRCGQGEVDFDLSIGC